MGGIGHILRITLSTALTGTFAFADTQTSFGQYAEDCRSDLLANSIRIGSCALALSADGATNADRSDLFVVLGELHADTQEYDFALRMYQMAIVNDPDNIEAYDAKEALVRTVLSELQNEPQILLAFASWGLEQDPGDHYMYLVRARAFEALGDYDKALNDLGSAMQLDVYPHWYQSRRANLYWDIGNPELALRDLALLSSQLVEGSSFDAEIRSAEQTAQGIEKVILGRWVRNLKTLKDYVLGLEFEIYSDTGAYEEALSVGEVWLAHSPKSVIPQVQVGQLYHQLNRHDDALTMFDRAVDFALRDERDDLGPVAVFALWERGTFFRELGLIDDAVRDFSMVLKDEEPGTIRELQRSMRDFGFYEGEIDGVFDSETQRDFGRCLAASLC